MGVKEPGAPPPDVGDGDGGAAQSMPAAGHRLTREVGDGDGGAAPSMPAAGHRLTREVGDGNGGAAQSMPAASQRLTRAEADRVFELAARSAGADVSRSFLSAETIMTVAREAGLPEQAVRDALAAVTAASADLAGRTVGRYRVLRRIGAGTGGTVYEAEDPNLGRRVALKVFGGAHGVADAYARFVREARALARIQHAHVVAVHDTGEADGLAYLAMQMCDGGALDQFLRPEPAPAWRAFLQSAGFEIAEGPPGRLDATLARRWLGEAALGLREAARHGLLHRDVKPSNLLLDERGRVKVADFGLAKVMAEAESALTRQGEVLGTPLYMSPEQVRGTPLDVRSDVYALGATFFHLLAGRPPFVADGAPASVLMARRLVDDAPSLRAVAPDVPADLADLVDAMMRRDQPARPADYDAVLAALEGRSLAPRAAAPRAPATTWQRWRRFWRGPTGAVVRVRAPGSPLEYHRALAKALEDEGFSLETAGSAASTWRIKDKPVLVEVMPDPEGVRAEMRLNIGPRPRDHVVAHGVLWGILGALAFGATQAMGLSWLKPAWGFFLGMAAGVTSAWGDHPGFLRRTQRRLEAAAERAARLPAPPR